MLVSLFGKYKALVISIALFLLLDASVLAVNFYTSYQIAQDAKTVNIAGRQRMLSQRMVKALFEVEKALAQQASPQAYLNELAQASQLFGQTLRAFEQGGLAPGVQNDAVLLAAVKPGAGRDALMATKEIWQVYEQLMDQLLKQKNPEDFKQALSIGMEYARANNVSLLNLMNNLTLELERVAGAKASQLRLIQAVAIVLAVVNFIIILWHFLGQLRRSDQALDAARKETQHILSTVNEGLFLLDKHLRMGSQHSAKLTQMFGAQGGGAGLEHCHFSDFLRDRVRPTDLDTALRFVNLLFRRTIKTSLIGDLNLDSRWKLTSPMSRGYTTKYIKKKKKKKKKKKNYFDFRRVVVAGEISQVLVTVKDITKEVVLSKELDFSRANIMRNKLKCSPVFLHANPMVKALYPKCL
ncbi:MAG: type IV pili methyl-accepting chemotaxis transducer N-terminal domain-containing protein [Marinagarivorans sp.]